MKLAVLVTFLLSVTLSFSQDKKKLLKLLDDDFVELAGQENYPWRPEGDFTYYESWTKKGDTTGVSNNLEFLMFRDSVFYAEGELFKLARKTWVTGDEWWDFVLWVQDSVIREKVYENNNNDIPDELLGQMLNHPEVYYDQVNKVTTKFDPSQPFINRGLFHFNYDFDIYKKIGTERIVPLISDLYLAPYSRYYRSKDLDKRKFHYVLTKGWGDDYIGLEIPVVPVYPDPFVWAEKSEYNFDLHYTLAKYYVNYRAFNHLPVQGVLGTQIKAYLSWKEKQLQAQIDAKNLNYRVRLALPSADEADSTCECPNERVEFETIEVDMNDHWRITNQDYKAFLQWVEDSVLMEAVYSNYRGNSDAELIGEMLTHDNVYFDDVNLSWTEFDPSQPFINRELYYFNWDYDWRKKLDPAIYNPIIKKKYDDEGNFLIENYVFKYYWEDLKRRSEWGEFEWIVPPSNEEVGPYYQSTGYFANRDLDLQNGIRRVEDISQYVVQEKINIYPTVKCQECNLICSHEHGELSPEQQSEFCDKCPDWYKIEFERYDFDSIPEALIQGLSYAQAIAYYHWKYEMNFDIGKKESYLFYSYFPSEEQFKKVQAGETIPPIQKNIPYATPFFRYVIHVYPK